MRSIKNIDALRMQPVAIFSFKIWLTQLGCKFVGDFSAWWTFSCPESSQNCQILMKIIDFSWKYDFFDTMDLRDYWEPAHKLGM